MAWVKTATAVIVCALMIAATGVSTASASTTHSSGNASQQSAQTLQETVQTFAVRSKAGAPVILCLLSEALKISNPHHSHHEPRNINVIATVSCSQAVPEITLVVSLFRNGRRVNSTTHNVIEKRFIKGNAASGCKGTAGNYQGTATARVVFPPKFVPPVETGHVKSRIIRVHCFS